MSIFLHFPKINFFNFFLYSFLTIFFFFFFSLITELIASGVQRIAVVAPSLKDNIITNVDRGENKIDQEKRNNSKDEEVSSKLETLFG